MWVVKLGGSLQSSVRLSEWLSVLARYGSGKVVIVPGGGRFADQVRLDQTQRQIDDDKAHDLALLAMEKFAGLLCGMEQRLKPADSIIKMTDIVQSNAIPVWLPSAMIRMDKELPASWDVTSDSLALWLADRLAADVMVLIKSAKLPEDYKNLDDLSGQGLIDNYFPRLYQRVLIPLAWFVENETIKMQKALQTNRVEDYIIRYL